MAEEWMGRGERSLTVAALIGPAEQVNGGKIVAMKRYFVGVDFGQSRDFTAIAVLERAEATGAWDPAMFA